MITQAAIQDVVSGCKEVFKHTVGHLKAATSHKLSESGIDASSINGLESVFEGAINPFAGVESQYLQEKFITQEHQQHVLIISILLVWCTNKLHTSHIIFILQEPVEVQVGSSHYLTRQTGSKRRKVLERDNFYYMGYYLL